jgi:alkyl sulfatase BDS1-like metallo-beta-lactamase superfamily hydrolase
MVKGKELFDSGKYLLSVEILNKLVFAEPKNQPARDLLADCFEQIGYKQENPGLRNSFLAGAYELRSGLPQGASPKSASPDVIRAMSTELFLDFLAIRMDSRKAEGMAFKINLVTPDNGEKFVIELSNATLTSIKGYQDPRADLTLTVARSDLDQVMTGAVALEKLIVDGKSKLQGNAKVLSQLASTMVQFEIGFEIMPGTRGATPPPRGNPFAVGPLNPRGE